MKFKLKFSGNVIPFVRDRWVLPSQISCIGRISPDVVAVQAPIICFFSAFPIMQWNTLFPFVMEGMDCGTDVR